MVNRESHDDDLVLSSMAQSAFETAEELVHKVWEEVSSWKTQPFSKLPKWLQDNDYLHHWHRWVWGRCEWVWVKCGRLGGCRWYGAVWVMYRGSASKERFE